VTVVVGNGVPVTAGVAVVVVMVGAGDDISGTDPAHPASTASLAIDIFRQPSHT